MKAQIIFVNNKLQEDFDTLKTAKSESKDLYKSLTKAFEALENDCFAGV